MIVDILGANFLDIFDRRTAERGLDYANKGYVLSHDIEEKPNTFVITGKVRGSGNKKYSVHIRLYKNSNRFSSTCSCPMRTDCKHVCAVMLVAAQEHTQSNNILDKDLSQWLQDTTSLLDQTDQNKAATLTLAFVLHIDEEGADALHIKPGLIKPLKKGGWSALKKLDLDDFRLQLNKNISQQQHIQLETLKVIAESSHYYEDDLYFKNKNATKALAMVLEAGLCFWESTKSEALSIADEKPLEVSWAINHDGSHSIKLNTNNPEDIILPTEPLWYYSPQQNTLGATKTELPAQLTRQLYHLPAIQQSQLAQFTESLQKVVPKNVTLPIPEALETTHITDEKPYLYLEISHQKFEAEDSFKKLDIIMARSMVRYDGHDIDPALTSTQHFFINKSNKVYQYHRDYHFETQAFKQLNKIGLTFLDDAQEIDDPAQYRKDYQFSYFVALKDDYDALVHFNEYFKPEIEAAGWSLEYKDDVPNYDFIEPDEWYSELNESSDYDWFNLKLGVIVDNEQVDLLPILLRSIQQADMVTTANNETILQLSSDKSIKIPSDRMQRILTVLSHLIDINRKQNIDQPLKIDKHKLALVKEMEKAFVQTQLRWLGDEKLLTLADKLSNFETLKTVEVSPDFNAELRPYQQTGVDWLQFLREYALNGILADDMGLGKTVQVLAHLATEKEQGRLTKPTLIVAPTSVVTNWKHEIERFTPHLSTLVLHGADRGFKFDSIPQHDIVLTSYALVTRDKEHLTKQDFYYVILDEAHYIKNKAAKKTQIVQQLNADHRLCLTGTPLENHLGELWSQFNFLMPGLLGKINHFKQQFQTPIEKHQNKEKQQLLTELTKPFMLRRTKQNVVQELPEKTEIIKYVELEKGQRDLYEGIRLAMDRKVRKAIDEKGIERSQIIILDALLKLRQACCDPRLLSIAEAKKVTETAKLDLLMQMLPEMISEGRKILLFSQFTGMLSLIEACVKEHNIDYVKLTGSTQNREKPISQFQKGDTPLFLISLKAGGVGLNLTAADTVIHYDPWWNPAVEQQATDRAHRIGQQSAVFVYKLITSNTIEEKIIEMQTHKRALADALFDTNSNTGKLNKSDLQKLFLPT